MLTLKKVAVTGSLGSGKTAVCRLLEELGACVVSADTIVHQLLSPNTRIGQEVIRLLGSHIINQGQLNRKAIANEVFSHPKKLSELEKILHPAVFEEIENHYRRAKTENKYKLFVAEIPLLYESPYAPAFDLVVCVTADPDVCRERFLKNKDFSEIDYTQRMTHQIDPKEKALRADYVIENNGTLPELKQKVITLYPLLTAV